MKFDDDKSLGIPFWVFMDQNPPKDQKTKEIQEIKDIIKKSVDECVEVLC